MKLRTVTLIWLAVLLFGAVELCRAQGIDNPPLLIVPDSCVTVARIDSGDTVITVSNPFGQSVKLPLYSRWPEPLTIDSLVVLWDEYKAECHADSGWMKFQSLAKCRELGYTVDDCGWHIKIYRKADFDGFADFIRRKAGE